MIRRTLRTARSLATDQRVPRWLRWLFLFGLLPIPVIPIDELALVVALGILATFHRDLVTDAWRKSNA